MIEKIHVTKEGLEELKREKDELIHVVRPAVIEELVAARSLGDLSENADYDTARDRQAKIELRIRELDKMLTNYEIIDESKKNKLVKIGSTVTIYDQEKKKEFEYSIVGSVEADPLNHKISNVSPLALAIMDRKPNDVCTVNVAKPYDVKIISIN